MQIEMLYKDLYKDSIVFLTGAIPKAILLLIIGLFAARFISIGFTKLTRHRINAHQKHVLKRVTFSVVFLIFLISSFEELGFHLSVLLGATGILTVAFGIASQTSLSNFVSGAFILGEKSFKIGDIIKVNDLQGEVISIDFLSVKIRTEDNNMIRIPNEVLIKSAVTNKSYFSTLRVDFTIELSYKENLETLQEVLLEVAEKNSFCLKEPHPTVAIQKFTNATVVMQFYVWGMRENYNYLKTSIQEEMKKALRNRGIEIPILPQIFNTIPHSLQ
jgi:small-conductance mechanosensitive channel